MAEYNVCLRASEIWRMLGAIIDHMILSHQDFLSYFLWAYYQCDTQL